MRRLVKLWMISGHLSLLLKFAKDYWPIQLLSDGLSARLLRRVPYGILVRILNIILWCGRVSTHLLESTTTLIPKKSNAHLPSDFRPITVSSVIIRTLHKILATRLANIIEFDQRQRAFRPTDGCSDNVFLLDMLLQQKHKQHKPLFMASLNMAKTFGSVSHQTISEALNVKGVPLPMIDYHGRIRKKYHFIIVQSLDI